MPEGKNSFKRFVQINEFENPNANAASGALRLMRNALNKLMRHCDLDALQLEWPPIASQNKDGVLPSSRQVELFVSGISNRWRHKCE